MANSETITYADVRSVTMPEIPICDCGCFEDEHIDNDGCFNCNYEQPKPICESFRPTYIAELGKVKSCTIGFQREDAIFLGISVEFDFGGSGQCFMSGIFDSYDKTKDRRIGTEVGCDYIVQFLDYFGIGKPEQLVDKYVYALRKKSRDSIVGFLLNEPDFSQVSKYHTKRKYKPFLNDKIFKEWGID